MLVEPMLLMAGPLEQKHKESVHFLSSVIRQAQPLIILAHFKIFTILVGDRCPSKNGPNATVQMPKVAAEFATR